MELLLLAFLMLLSATIGNDGHWTQSLKSIFTSKILLMPNRLRVALTGTAMGIAEAIPGVSGGTIAFITGIYETLIDTIKSVDIEALKLLSSFKFAAFAEKINLSFLLPLLVGMAGGLLLSVFFITEMLLHFPEYLWAFFFGLILASALYIARQIPQWKLSYLLWLVTGIVIAVAICRLTPVEGETSMWYLLLSGILAITALVLPGISGSFILLILGMYTVVTGTLRNLIENPNSQDLINLSIFALGCVLGLVTFSRVISWVFDKYQGVLLSLMTGFILGSLYKIWPWREPTSVMNDAGVILKPDASWNWEQIHEVKVLSESLVWPQDYQFSDPNPLIIAMSAVLGALLVWVMSRVNRPAKP